MRSEPGRFFDGDGNPGDKLVIALERDEDAEDKWQLRRRIGYLDRGFKEPFLVPKNKETFRTDLTSVPALFTWLIPKTGTHLPAALLHDGLVVRDSETGTHLGPAVDRLQADRIFRDAMGDSQTPLVRRWLIWTGVSLASVATVRPRTLSWLMYAVLAAVPLLGVIATLDFFDVLDWLPWMGQRPWWQELLLGMAGAVVIPPVLVLPWARARLYRAGLIAGLAIAMLLHVTIAVGFVSLSFLLLEIVVDRIERRRALRSPVPGPESEPGAPPAATA